MSNTTEQQHDKSSHNKRHVQKSDRAGCFYCEKMFPASKVKDFTKERKGEDTALCPYCRIDSVVCDKDVILTSELLSLMHQEWFTAHAEDPK